MTLVLPGRAPSSQVTEFYLALSLSVETRDRTRRGNTEGTRAERAPTFFHQASSCPGSGSGSASASQRRRSEDSLQLRLAPPLILYTPTPTPRLWPTTQQYLTPPALCSSHLLISRETSELAAANKTRPAVTPEFCEDREPFRQIVACAYRKQA